MELGLDLEPDPLSGHRVALLNEGGLKKVELLEYIEGVGDPFVTGRWAADAHGYVVIDSAGNRYGLTVDGAASLQDGFEVIGTIQRVYRAATGRAS